MRRELSAALHRAVAQREPVYYRGLQLQAGGGDRALTVNLTVRPVAGRPDDPTTRDLFLVVFEQVEPAAPLAEAPPTANAADAPDRPGDGRVAALEQELRAKDEYLQTTLEEMQTSNEELRSTNEEMQSVNEELQSTNEELETSKEELQSVNEELATVNAELQQKVLDLSRANNDMNNLLAGTGVGTLFVDMRLRIARFTPTITKVINLIQPDVGRPVGDIVSNLAGYDRLVQDVQAVLDTLIPVEAEVQSRTGVWYLMRIMPYRTLEQMIEGAVLTFTEITQRKLVEAALSQLQKAAERLAKGFQAIPAALAISSAADGRISEVNEGFLARYGVMRDAVLGRTAAELGLALGPDDPTATLRLVREHGVYLYESTIQAADGQPQPTITAIGEVELDGQPHLLTLTLDRRA
jgi:two-component system CheB/CheR fusion protein